MYKVTYYMTGSNKVSFREFKTFTEACDFARNQPLESVMEIKLYPDEDNKKENRT
jgi:hypothetical protein